MKKILSLAAIVLFCYSISAQISHGGKPYSFTNDGLKSDIEHRKIAPPDVERLIMEDLVNESKSVPYRIGVLLEAKINPDNSGTWDELNNGYKLWRIHLSSDGAQALNLYFDDFFLPQGAKLFVYSTDKNQVIGSFTEFNNHESRLFATQYITGNEIIVELYLPLNATNYTLNISDIGYAYRETGNIYETKDISCMVNVKCPEGNNWQNQKQGVARTKIVIGSYQYMCSGSLANNTNDNCAPYFLSAQHCFDDATATNFNQMIFYFNYEASTCAGTIGPQTQTVIGAQLKASSPTFTSFNGTNSDMSLLLLNNNVPQTYNPYFSGWSRATTASPSGVGIHHPDGNIKKISTYTSTLTNYYTTHWQVIWASTVTNHSVTYVGSSGSPIFNNNGLIVGTLSTGASACDNLTGPDQYGKFSFHWQSNGTTTNRQLKPWLDPVGSNPTTLQGTSYATCDSSQSIEYNKSGKNQFDMIEIHPNPTSDIATIKFNFKQNESSQIYVYDLMGKMVMKAESNMMSDEFTISAKELKAGLYNIVVFNNNEIYTRKLSVIR